MCFDRLGAWLPKLSHVRTVGKVTRVHRSRCAICDSDVITADTELATFVWMADSPQVHVCEPCADWLADVSVAQVMWSIESCCACQHPASRLLPRTDAATVRADRMTTLTRLAALAGQCVLCDTEVCERCDEVFHTACDSGLGDDTHNTLCSVCRSRPSRRVGGIAFAHGLAL